MNRILQLIALVTAFYCYSTYGIELSTIDGYCKEFNYSKCSLVKALIAKESSFNHKAFVNEKSGSYGLMMIQCSTAKDKRLKNPLEGHCSKLFDPKINIRYGIMYLKLIEKTLRVASIENIFSAYNAGFDFKNKTCIETIGSKCVRWNYGVRRCKEHTFFKYPGFSMTECFPGERINEEYVWRLMRTYYYYEKLKN